MWQQNRYAINGWLAIPNGFSAEVMANQGWDTLTVDMQHGVIDYAQMVPMLQAISTTATVPIVRVPWLEPGIVMKSLDAGAYGIICPMVNTREDAQRLVSYTHYAPRGSRSFGPVRASLYGGSDYATKANDTIVVFAMIETKQALDNLDVDPRRSKGSMRSTSGRRTCRSRSAAVRCSTTSIRRRRRPSPHPGARQGARRARRRAQRPARGGQGARGDGLLTSVTLSSDARILTAGSQELLKAMK